MTERVTCKLADSRRLLLLAVALSIAVPSALGQAAMQADPTAAKLPEYDVVSIKPDNSGAGSVSIQINIDRFAATNVSLKNLLENAYDIREDLISGITGPIGSAQFDVVAKIVDPDPTVIKKLTGSQRRSMLLPFLVERFQLKAHTEFKTLPVYELVVVPSGPKFKQSADPKHGPYTSVRNSNNNATLTADAVPMADLANTLAHQLHRTVIDKTGLAGSYDLALKWSPDDDSTAQTDSAPSLFTSLQEQLGLKLQPAKGPVETLVVDHAEMPSEN
jgi:uncharacterized protein (TIGR03435 family)